MKYLKINVTKKRTIARCEITYPDFWDNDFIRPIVYEGQDRSYSTKLGTVTEGVVCLVTDELAEVLIKDGNATELTLEEANVQCRSWMDEEDDRKTTFDLSKV